jgi:hypothetical protein
MTSRLRRARDRIAPPRDEPRDKETAAGPQAPVSPIH